MTMMNVVEGENIERDDRLVNNEHGEMFVEGNKSRWQDTMLQLNILKIGTE